MIPKAQRFENNANNESSEVCVEKRSTRLRLVLGAEYWCRRGAPHELVLDGSAEVDRLEYFDAFCRSGDSNHVQIVRIRTFNWALHPQCIPALATALGVLPGLRAVHFEKLSHGQTEYEVVRAVLEATRHSIEEVYITCDDVAFSSENNLTWYEALSRCERLRRLDLDRRAGILLRILSEVPPLRNPHLQEICLQSASQVELFVLSFHFNWFTALPSLRRLKLENSFWCKNACQVLNEVLLRHGIQNSLTHLELPSSNWNTCGDNLFLGSLPRVLEHLNLSNCYLNHDDMIVLAKRIPQTRVAYLNLADNPALTDVDVTKIWKALRQTQTLRHLDLQRTSLSPETLSILVQEKEEAFPKLETLYIDRQGASRPWTAKECKTIAQTLIKYPRWVDLGSQWESARPQPLWREVDSILRLNRSGRAKVLKGQVDPVEFLRRVSVDIVAIFLHLQHDAVAMGVFPSPRCSVPC